MEILNGFLGCIYKLATNAAAVFAAGFSYTNQRTPRIQKLGSKKSTAKMKLSALLVLVGFLATAKGAPALRFAVWFELVLNRYYYA